MITLTLVCALTFGAWTPPQGWAVVEVQPGQMASTIMLTPMYPSRADWSQPSNGTPTRVKIQRTQTRGETVAIPTECHAEAVTPR